MKISFRKPVLNTPQTSYHVLDESLPSRVVENHNVAPFRFELHHVHISSLRLTQLFHYPRVLQLLGNPLLHRVLFQLFPRPLVDAPARVHQVAGRRRLSRLLVAENANVDFLLFQRHFRCAFLIYAGRKLFVDIKSFMFFFISNINSTNPS